MNNREMITERLNMIEHEAQALRKLLLDDEVVIISFNAMIEVTVNVTQQTVSHVALCMPNVCSVQEINGLAILNEDRRTSVSAQSMKLAVEIADAPVNWPDPEIIS